MKLGLIGKEISHSLSPLIYKTMINEDIDYSLLDYSDETNIPTLKYFAKQGFHGLNITAPYKKFFLNDIETSPFFKELESINCIKIEKGSYLEYRCKGISTDFYAILKIILNLIDFIKKIYPFKTYYYFIVLGDGSMSKMIVQILDGLKLPYEITSRKIDHEFYHENLIQNKIETKLDQIKVNKFNFASILINTCARSFIIPYRLSPDTILWDLNYNIPIHDEKFSRILNHYLNGKVLLIEQAFYATKFFFNQ